MAKPNLHLARAEQRRVTNRETILHAAEAVPPPRVSGPCPWTTSPPKRSSSEATLYRYFRSKAELVFEIVLHFLEDLDTGLEEEQARYSEHEEFVRPFPRGRGEGTSPESSSWSGTSSRSCRPLSAMGPDRARVAGKFIQKIKAKRQALVDDTIAEVRGIASEFRPANPRPRSQPPDQRPRPGLFRRALSVTTRSPTSKPKPECFANFILPRMALPHPRPLKEPP